MSRWIPLFRRSVWSLSCKIPTPQLCWCYSGYAIACLLPPQVANLLSQVLVFVVLLFSPVSYPASRLPDWLAELHHWLPIEPMADAMRACLVGDRFAMPLRSTIVLAAWCLASLVAATWSLRRRT